MDYFQYDEVAGAVMIFFAVCGAIVLVGGAAKVIFSLFKPKLDIEERLDHCDECLDNDNERIGKVEADTKLILRAMLQLVQHDIDGNHIEAMKEVRDELENYLIKR